MVNPKILSDLERMRLERFHLDGVNTPAVSNIKSRVNRYWPNYLEDLILISKLLNQDAIAKIASELQEQEEA